MCFIKLTVVNPYRNNDESEIWVNASKIVCISINNINNKIYTCIGLDGDEDNYIRVKETPEEVLNKIQGIEK